MLLYGDECRRTQRGNNNAYCQDNAVSWFDWTLVDKNPDLLRFTQSLIHFRRRQPTVRRTDFLRGEPDLPGALPDVSWYSPDGQPMCWNGEGPSITCLFGAPATADMERAARHLLMLFNAGPCEQEFVLPQLSPAIRWRLFLDTEQESPLDIYPDLDGPAPAADGKVLLTHHSMVCFVSASVSI
jgi:glycogen operon protein